MKPRTKLQVRVKALSDALPKLTEEQKKWALNNCLLHLAYRTKTKTACLDCGHVWATDDNTKLLVIFGATTCICPGCGVKLTIKDTRKKKTYQRKFFGWLSVCEDYQVNRFFEIHSHHKAGKAPYQVVHEVVQQLMQPDGKNEVIAMNRGSMGGFSDHFHGVLEIRHRDTISWKYNIYPDAILPGAKCLPIYKRNGVRGKIDIKIGPYDLFTAIIKDNIAETLLKSKQYDLLAGRVGDGKYKITCYWDSIKICIRNKYIVKEAITWLDYLQLLAYFKKDLRNPKYICPKDLNTEHNKLVAKKTEIDKRARYTSWLEGLGIDVTLIKNWSTEQLQVEYDRLIAEKNAIEKLKKYKQWLIQLGKDAAVIRDWSIEQLTAEYDSIQSEKAAEQRAKAEEEIRKKMGQDEAAYQKAKAAFFGIVFSSDHLTIKVLENIQEFIEEGEVHKHCVFTNGYYKKEDSLILSARLDGKPLETIEIDLKKMKITQSRGLENKASDYNQQILELVRKNMRIIKKKYKELKSVAA